jgi:hypothetical protein
MTARRLATTEACARHAHEHPDPDPAQTGSALTVHCQVRVVGGEAGRALAAAQGRALSALLACLAETEVGQDQEVLP